MLENVERQDRLNGSGLLSTENISLRELDFIDVTNGCPRKEVEENSFKGFFFNYQEMSQLNILRYTN